jgi:glycolate oxidase iron-sulfur subunit
VSNAQNPVDGSPCVHCGLCLEACPTYRLTGIEAESPRGRLYLMKAIADGRMALDAGSASHLDSCLGCLSCETACPSGVAYRQHIEGVRPQLLGLRRGTFRGAAYRALRSERFQRAAVGIAAFLDALGLERFRRILPGIGLVSARRKAPRRTRMPDTSLDSRTQQPTVALLIGCGARVFRPSLESAVRLVLAVNGVQVVALEPDHCCGALALHEGRDAEARALASATLRRAAELGVDHVVTAAAGCRAALEDLARARSFEPTSPTSAPSGGPTVREICELLVEIEFRRPITPVTSDERIVAYHDACHLVHAAKIVEPPRSVLGATGMTVRDLGENSICCGSAGTYNITHVKMADALGARKAELAAAGAFRQVAVANLGCILQIERALALSGCASVRVAHPVEYLSDAYLTEGLRRD